jgi:hypothetical protein
VSVRQLELETAANNLVVSVQRGSLATGAYAMASPDRMF